MRCLEFDIHHVVGPFLFSVRIEVVEHIWLSFFVYRFLFIPFVLAFCCIASLGGHVSFGFI